MGTSQYDEKLPYSWTVRFVNGGATSSTLITAGTQSTARVDDLIAVSTCTADRTLDVQLIRSSIPYSYGKVLLPAGAGSVAVPAVNVMDSIRPTAGGGITPAGGDTLAIAIDSAPGAGENVTVVAQGGLL